MRLRSLLTIAELGFELLCGAENQDRFVRWVITTDLLDPGRYLSGGELVLTGLHWRHGAADSEAFVSALAGAGVAGVVAGQARYGGVPQDVVEACRRHRMPLFTVPVNVSFSVVTEHINRGFAIGRAADLSAALHRNRELVADGGLGSVLALLERDFGLRCWVMTSTGRLVAGSGTPPAAALDTFLRARNLPVVLRDAVPYTVFAVDGPRFARAADWLLIFEGDRAEWPEERRAIVADLAAVVSLERARPDDERRVEVRLARELVEQIAGGARGSETAVRLDLTGLGTADSYLAVAATIDLDALRPRELRGLLREILHGTPCAVGSVDSEAIALLPADADPVGNIRRTVATLTPGLHGSRLAVGVSAAVEQADLRIAVEQARVACRSAVTGPNSVVAHEDLTARTLLLASVPDDVRLLFQVRLLHPLRAYDRLNRTDLVHTLEKFLEVSGAWTRCAELLHIHVGTLRNRIQRIEELTGRDLSRLEDRANFVLALALR
ncbi:PucR family transcriptional regulator [Nocardia tenerifensis]|uniref:PucR family transcriptional regulator n=1 Tax=Nocardia tenerifensis TaxID=228006 RepID=UPI000592E1CC|nr:PucR family transcriptional regulator [Nocardia tenerifensis]